MFSRRRIDKSLILKEDYPIPKASFPLWRVLFVIFSAFIAIGLAETARAENGKNVHGRLSAPVSPNNAKAGQLLFKSDSGHYTQAIHLQSKNQLTITGMVATAELTQSFQNTSSEWQEGIYVFPLPEKAAVSYMEMQIGDRRIVSKIKEKQEAKRIYTQAKKQGKKAALVEQERPNLFTQSVANIAPGETISVTLRYQHAVTYDQGKFSVRIPMTLTPRYIPGNALLNDDIEITNTGSHGWGWSVATDQVKDAHRITPFMQSSSQVLSTRNSEEQTSTKPLNPMTLSVSLNAGLPLAAIDSPYHDIVINKANGKHQVTTRTSNIPMDRDFELRWQPVAEQAPSAAVFMETTETIKTKDAQTESPKTSDDYALLMLLPPQQESLTGTLPRQAIFIIDTSGSMQGSSIVQAKQSLQLALTRLGPQDQFNIIEFNSNYTQLFSQPQTADTQNIQRAQQFVNRLQANGGTEMAPALQAALTSPEQEGFLKQVVFITDGSVGNETALFALIDQHLNNARLFTVGIGSAPNSFFMRKSAEFGRGTFTYIGKTQEVAERMDSLFRKLESPVLSNLSIEWPDSVQAESWPKQLPDLYLGEPLLVHSRFDKGLSKGDHSVIVRGKIAGQDWQRSLKLTKVSSKEANAPKGIAKLWGREKISALLDEKVRGRDASEVRNHVLAVALQHQLMSPYTSLVAVEEKISRPVSEALKQSGIPNLVAKGQKPQPQAMVKKPHKSKTVSYPSTATSGPLNLLLGFLALVILLAIRFNPHVVVIVHD
jgi:Ca-activated chloride channel homolog